MKYLLVAFATLLLTGELCAEPFNFVTAVGECAQELGSKYVDINEAIQNKDEKLGCAVACAMKAIGMMHNGKLDKDFMVRMIENEKIYNPNHSDKSVKLFWQCYDEATKQDDLSECDLALKFLFCTY